MKYFSSGTIIIASIFTLSAIAFNSSAQVIAGSVPQGTSIQNPNIVFSTSTIGTTLRDSFDIDCDGIKDIAVELHRRNTDVDNPNAVWYRLLNNALEICADTSSFHFEVPFYSIGDTMASGIFQWRSDSVHRLACGGGFCWTGFYELTDKYFAYRKSSTQEIGWIKISYDLWWDTTITASINEVLVLCEGNGTNDLDHQVFFSISPNPSANGIIKLHSRSKIIQVELINVMGQVVKTIAGNKTEIVLPEEKGIYMLRISNDKGQVGVAKACRE